MTAQQSCDECGFQWSSVSPDTAADALRSLGRRYQAPLTRFLAGEDPDELVRRRPDESTWSVLEYAAHIRDVLRVWNWGVKQAAAEDGFVFPRADIDPDRTARDAAYNEHDRLTTAAEIADSAERFAVRTEKLSPEEWRHTATFDPDTVTVEWMVGKALHEGHHHLLDIGRVLRAVRSR